MGNGIVWDDEQPQAKPRAGIVWDDEAATASEPSDTSKDWQQFVVSHQPFVAPSVKAALSVGAGLIGKLDDEGTLLDLIRGGEQGATFGLSDEVVGGANALMRAAGGEAKGGAGDLGAPGLTDLIAPKGNTFLDLYRQERDKERSAYATSQERSPTASLVGEVGGGVASALIPIPGGALAQGARLTAKLGRAAAQGAAAGGLYGFGTSEGDLTRGEVGQVAADTALGAGIGAGAGGLAKGAGEGLGKVLNFVRGRAGRGVADAVAQETATQEQLADKAIQSALGKYRSGVQGASRDLEVMAREAADLPDSDPLKRSLLKYLNSEEGMALRKQVAGNKLESAQERIGEMDALRAEYQQLLAGKGANVEAQVGEALRDPFRKHVAPRVWTLGHRFLPPAIAAAGGLVGGPVGAAVGGAVGVGMSLVQGAPGRIIKNLISKPASRKWFWEKVLKATGGSGRGVIPALENAAAKSEQQFAAVAYVLSQRNPEARALLKKVAEVLQGEDEELPEEVQAELAAR